GEFPISHATFADPKLIFQRYDEVRYMGSWRLDYLVGPLIGLLGLAHCVAALLYRRWTRETSAIFALTLLALFCQRHTFLSPHNFHVVQSLAPATILFVALAASARATILRLGRRLRVPLGRVAVLSAAALFLLGGATQPVGMRIVRLASGEERPSFGPP